jgi:hypothetical protein
MHETGAAAVHERGRCLSIDDDAAYLQLVENVEAIMAEEQQVYRRNRGGQDSAARQIGSTAPGKKAAPR